MEMEITYRHELKYTIDYPRYLELRARLKPLLHPDVHAGADGRYLIRSIYFDNPDDKALREKINGVSRREKFRIRYYNDDRSFLVLEKKIKNNNLCKKLHTVITEEECLLLLDNQIAWMRSHKEPLIQELYAKMRYQQLKPRVLVSYYREAYVYSAGNVRITFDSDIRTTLYHRPFPAAQISDIRAAIEPQDMILEIKYDAFLPEIIKNIIQTDGICRQAFSKYAACRRFG